MKALIVGLGNIGRRHLANLRQIEPKAQLTIWRQHSGPQGGENFTVPADSIVFRQEDALDSKPDLALIAGPASRHIETGLALAQQGIHLFIEKPLSHTLDGVDDLLHLCQQRSLVLMVGYNLRFYRPLQVMRQALLEGRIGRPLAVRAEVGQYLPEWRPSKDYRHCVSAKQELGGGVVLELSHELDYVRWLMGEVKTVCAQIGHLSDLEIDVEDTAEIILQFDNGVIGSIHLNMFQHPPTRECRITGTEGTLVLDGIRHRVRLFSAASQAWSDLYNNESLDRNDSYLRELRFFLDCVKESDLPAQPAAHGAEARRILEIILAAKQSAKEQRVIEL
jgi:predicted dehydrogenase